MGTHSFSSTVPNRTNESPCGCVPGRWTGETDTHLRNGSFEDHGEDGGKQIGQQGS